MLQWVEEQLFYLGKRDVNSNSAFSIFKHMVWGEATMLPWQGSGEVLHDENYGKDDKTCVTPAGHSVSKSWADPSPLRLTRHIIRQKGVRRSLGPRQTPYLIDGVDNPLIHIFMQAQRNPCPIFCVCSQTKKTKNKHTHTYTHRGSQMFSGEYSTFVVFVCPAMEMGLGRGRGYGHVLTRQSLRAAWNNATQKYVHPSDRVCVHCLWHL